MEKGTSFVSSLRVKRKGLSLAKNDYGLSSDIILFQKWAYRVEKGWYGFALADAPNFWAVIIDEFLQWLEVQAPDFKIHQIKLKMGSARIYLDLSSLNEEKRVKINKEIQELEEWLSHKSLIY